MTETPREQTTPDDDDAAADGAEGEGPPEIVEAALQELEYPADETDEG